MEWRAAHSESFVCTAAYRHAVCVHAIQNSICDLIVVKKWIKKQPRLENSLAGLQAD